MVSCEVYLCFRSICSGNDLLGCAPSKVNWQTGTSLPTADARQPSSAMPTSASCFTAFPLAIRASPAVSAYAACLQEASDEVGAAIKIVLRESHNERPPLRGPELGSEMVRPQC